MSKSIRFNSGSNGIGTDAGPFTIYQTSRNESNKLIDQVSKSQLDSGLNLYGIDNDKFKFIIFNSASGAEQEVFLPGPTISSFSPVSGREGDNIVISGSGFVGTTSLFFGDTAGSYSISSNSEIIGIVGVGNTGKITITTPGGTAVSQTSFTYITPESELIYDLGTYYYDKDNRDTVCSNTAPTTFRLFSKDYTSLSEALNTQTVVYRDNSTVIKALPGYYAPKEPEPDSYQDISHYFYIDSNGFVTSRLRCNELPTEIDEKGSNF